MRQTPRIARSLSSAGAAPSRWLHAGYLDPACQLANRSRRAYGDIPTSIGNRVRPCDFRMMEYHPHTTTSRGKDMYRLIATLFLLVASAATSSAQGLFPSAWQGQRGSILKVLGVDPATGNFTGVFISNPAPPCPAVPFDLAGRARGPRVAFQTSRTWTADCRVTTVWSGRFVGPTTVATRWVATFVAPNGRVVRTRGTEIFQRL